MRYNSQEQDSLDLYLREVRKLPSITRSEEIELGYRSIRGDKAARDELVKANLRFVISVAKQYRNNGISLGDLINEGNLGLIRAAEKYDPAEFKDIKFISYAVWWIRQAVLGVVTQDRAIRLPINQGTVYNRLRKAQKCLEQRLGSVCTDTTRIAAEVGVTKDLADDILRATNVHSLDTPLGEDASYSLIDLIEDNSPSIDDPLETDDVQANIQKALAGLKERERTVITKYFGFEDSQTTYTLEDIGAELNISRERVRQIKDYALAKLKKNRAVSKLHNT